MQLLSPLPECVLSAFLPKAYFMGNIASLGISLMTSKAEHFLCL